jgi:CRP-like cAMP-binding protein
LSLVTKIAGDILSKISSSFTIDIEKFLSSGINDPRTIAGRDLIKSKSLSSDQRLFLSLWSSTRLKTVIFESKKKIMTAGSLVEEGYLIISGSLVGVEDENIYRFGPGAVLGLAEGMINHPSKMSVITTTAVQARLIPFHKIDTIISLLPKEMRAILQTIVKRTLDLS